MVNNMKFSNFFPYPIVLSKGDEVYVSKRFKILFRMTFILILSFLLLLANDYISFDFFNSSSLNLLTLAVPIVFLYTIIYLLVLNYIFITIYNDQI